jgi:hypothetical protein
MIMALYLLSLSSGKLASFVPDVMIEVMVVATNNDAKKPMGMTIYERSDRDLDYRTGRDWAGFA